MRKITVELTEQQEHFLKLFAANHYPGAKDNLATHNPIHIVQSKIINHIPYSPDIADYYEHLPLVFSLDPDCQLWHKNETELVEQYYKDRGKEPPIPIKPFKKMQYTEVHGQDGSAVWVQNYQDYFKTYNIEPVAIAWKKVEYKNVAFFFILEEARRYIKYQGHNLREPRTYSYSAGYSNHGEYHHFYDLLFQLGKKLNTDDITANAS